MNYPTLEEIEKADRVQLCRWYRFLQLPKHEAEMELSDWIYERFIDQGGFTPEISKQIGWEQR